MTFRGSPVKALRIGTGPILALLIALSLAGCFLESPDGDGIEGHAARPTVSTPSTTGTALAARPGVSDTTILFGQSAAFSGPAQELGRNMRLGIEAAFHEVNRRFGIPLPVEVAYDEFTEDIEENRLLKTALHRLPRLPVRSEQSRRGVNGLRPAFNTVELGDYRQGTPSVQYTRLNSHYRPAVELARLIIDNSSLELFHGEVSGASFMLDMNTVFEQFLFVALREALGLSGREWKRGERLTLDVDGKIRLNPDLSWWSNGHCCFVGDAKYKRLMSERFPNADIYQVLAYCTAVDLPSGLLVYAAGESETGRYRIKHTDKTIEVESLNLAGQPEDILAQVNRLAEKVKDHSRTMIAAA